MNIRTLPIFCLKFLIDLIGGLNALASVANDKTDEILNVKSVKYLDKYHRNRYYILDDGAIKIDCFCNKENNIDLIDPNGNLLRTYSCTNDTVHSTIAAITIGENLTFGEYKCATPEGKRSRVGFNLAYKLCSANNPACKETCRSDAKGHQFCVQTSQHPQGQSCSIPSENSCSKIYPGRLYFCPGNYRSFCEAAKAGVQNIRLEQYDISCQSAEYTPYITIGGRKLHMMEAVPLDKKIATMIEFHCHSESHFRNYTVDMQIFNVNFTRNDRKCPGSYQLPVETLLRKTAPAKLLAMINFSSGLRPNASLFFDLILFLDEITLLKGYHQKSLLPSVSIKMKKDIDPEFQFVVEGLLDGEKAKMIDRLTVVVSKPGMLRVKLTQAYVSCVPYTRIDGPALEASISITKEDMVEFSAQKGHKEEKSETKPVKGKSVGMPWYVALIIVLLVIIIFILLVLLYFKSPIHVFISRSRPVHITKSSPLASGARKKHKFMMRKSDGFKGTPQTSNKSADGGEATGEDANAKKRPVYDKIT